ncbi:hypothetical protein ACFXJO_05540 [Streptomyces lavendulae]|uniref:hypothetical protein n=1 Tax=Streptomyces lavendulae TaxID=1914 RepID=UPI0036887FCA
MGYAHYEITRNGKRIEAGYGVAATFEQDGCEADIDRGLAYLCGKEPGGDEHGCGGYFCSEHHYMSGEEQVGDLCGPCIATYRREQQVNAD